MSLFSLFHRDRVQARDLKTALAAIVDELDSLTSAVSAWCLNQHSEDGTHNTRPGGIDFVPVGGLIYWPLTTPPAGWLLANGAAISRAAYPLLFTTIGISSGAGDGVNTFNIPTVANHIILAI